MATRMVVTQDPKAATAYSQPADFIALSSRCSSSSDFMTMVKTRSLAEIYEQTDDGFVIFGTTSLVSPPSYEDVTEKSFLEMKTYEVLELLITIPSLSPPSQKEVTEKSFIQRKTKEVLELLSTIPSLSPPSYKEVTEMSLRREGIISPVTLMSLHIDSSTDSPPISHQEIIHNDLPDDSEVMLVMMTDTPSLEDRVANLVKALEALTDTMRERDRQMEYVINMLENKELAKTSTEDDPCDRKD